MYLVDTQYACTFSYYAFEAILEGLAKDTRDRGGMIAFIDGDANNIHDIIETIYDYRKDKVPIYVIVLLDDISSCSIVLRHLSDAVLDKKIAFEDLSDIIGKLVAGEPKTLSDPLYGDVLGSLLKSTRKEQQIVKLLMQGCSQSEIARSLNLSVKTVSSYKIKAVKRHGSRNFNELLMSRIRPTAKEDGRNQESVTHISAGEKAFQSK